MSTFVDICSLSMRAVNYRHGYISMGPSCLSSVIRYILYIKSCVELLTPGISRGARITTSRSRCSELLKFSIHCQFLAPRPFTGVFQINYQRIDCTHERVDFGQLKVDSAAANQLDLFATAIRRRHANFQWPSVYGGNNSSDPYILAPAGSPAVGSVHVIAVVGILGLNAWRCLDDKTTPAETPEQMLSPPSLSRKIWYACWYNRTQLFSSRCAKFALIPTSGGVSDFVASV